MYAPYQQLGGVSDVEAVAARAAVLVDLVVVVYLPTGPVQDAAGWMEWGRRAVEGHGARGGVRTGMGRRCGGMHMGADAEAVHKAEEAEEAEEAENEKEAEAEAEEAGRRTASSRPRTPSRF